MSNDDWRLTIVNSESQRFVSPQTIRPSPFAIHISHVTLVPTFSGCGRIRPVFGRVWQTVQDCLQEKQSLSAYTHEGSGPCQPPRDRPVCIAEVLYGTWSVAERVGNAV